jgi:hypothetical protein
MNQVSSVSMPKRVKLITADDLSKQIKVLQNQLFNAKAHFDIYMGLRRDWNKYIHEIQNSPIFWQFTMRAHIDTAFLYLCRAYDSDERALHLSAFLENIAKNPGLFCEAAFRDRHKARPGLDGLARHTRNLNLKQLSEDRDFCDRKNPLIANFLRWRNNLVAHFNYEEAVVVQQPLHKRHPLPFEDIKKLIDEGLDIVNRYYGLLDAATYSNTFFSYQEADYLYILKSLRFARIGRKWNRRRKRNHFRRNLAQDKRP